MRVVQMPSFGERLELRTWCSGIAKSVAERSTSIGGDAGASAEVEAIWVHVDPATRRPSRLPAGFAETYAESAAGRRPRSSLRHPASPPEGAERHEWRFARADTDLAGHVNNAAYWRVAEDLLELSALERDGALLEAEYRSGIETGPASVHRAGGKLWVSKPDGAVAAILAMKPLASG